MNKEKKDFLSEIILRLAVEKRQKVSFGEVYHSILLFYPALIEAEKEFKDELKKLIELINKLGYEEQVKLLEKEYKISRTYSPKNYTLSRKIPDAKGYVKNFNDNRKVIGLSTRLNRSGVKTINTTFSPHSPVLDGKRLFSSYFNLLKDKRLGEDVELMRGIFNHRKEIIQYRGTYNVTLYGDGAPMGQFKVISCLVEHGQEIVNFFHGLTIDMSGEDGFTKYLRAFYNSVVELGITQVIPTQYPSGKFQITEVKTDYSFA